MFRHALDLSILRQDFGLHVSRPGFGCVELDHGLFSGHERPETFFVENVLPAADGGDRFCVADLRLERSLKILKQIFIQIY